MKSISLSPLHRVAAVLLPVWSLMSLVPAPLVAQEADPAPAESATAEPAGEGEPTAEDQEKAFNAAVEKLGWTRGGTGRLGDQAEIAIPKGYRFTSGDGTRSLLEMYGNLVGTSEQGLLAPEDMEWFVVFDWDPVGYVKDDEKDSLDADKILKEKQEHSAAANEERKKRGIPALNIVGWKIPPHYDPQTNRLEWALLLRNEGGGESVNYNIKLLGREGVMDATIVCDADALDAVLPVAKKTLHGFQYTSGHSYAEYRQGDKIAAYGLTGLIVGGGAVLAAKAGWFAVLAKFFSKLGKGVIVLIAVALAAVGKLWKKLSGRGESA